MMPERCHQSRREMSEDQLIGFYKGFAYSFSSCEEYVSVLVSLKCVAFSNGSCLGRGRKICLSWKQNVLLWNVNR